MQKVDELAALRAKEAEADKRISTLVSEGQRAHGNLGGMLEPVGGYLRGTDPDPSGVPSFSQGGGYHQEVKFPKGHPPQSPFYSNFNGQLKQEPGVRKNGTYCLEKRPPWHSDYDAQMGSSAGASLKQRRAEARAKDDAHQERDALRQENAELRRAYGAHSVAGARERPAWGKEDHDRNKANEGDEFGTLRRHNTELRKAIQAKSVAGNTGRGQGREHSSEPDSHKIRVLRPLGDITPRDTVFDVKPPRRRSVQREGPGARGRDWSVEELKDELQRALLNKCKDETNFSKEAWFVLFGRTAAVTPDLLRESLKKVDSRRGPGIPSLYA